MRFLVVALTSVLLAASAPKSPTTTATDLNHPYGKANPFVSPDGKYALWGDYEHSELEMEDTGAHTDRPVAGMTVQTITLAWSPDSSRFAVNDRETSSESDAYIFNAATLERTKLRDRLTAARPQVARYYLNGVATHGRDVDHSYLDVLRWLDDQHVELQLHGHTAARFAHDNPDGHLYPAECFDLRYRVGLDGSVQRISGRVFSMGSGADDDACGWG
jgi:hypothetical protein